MCNQFKNVREIVENMTPFNMMFGRKCSQGKKIPWTPTAVFGKEVLTRLNRDVKRKRPEIADRWKLHLDNASPHTAFVVITYLARIGVATFPQTSYRTDLTPADFFLFPKPEKSPFRICFRHLKGCHRVSERQVTVVDFQGDFAVRESR